MSSTQHARLIHEQLSDGAGTTVSSRRLRRHDGLCRERIPIGDRKLRLPQTPGPRTPYLVQAVTKMPLVFMLHERGVPVSRIARGTRLAPSTVRAWIKKYGRFSVDIEDCLIFVYVNIV
jgi:DNA-binding IclR family transcriptional regulator